MSGTARKGGTQETEGPSSSEGKILMPGSGGWRVTIKVQLPPQENSLPIQADTALSAS